jgi:hypothetical protein
MGVETQASAGSWIVRVIWLDGVGIRSLEVF